MNTTLLTVATANGQRASIALQECAIDYQTQHVDLLAGEHRRSELLAVNPIGRLPLLAVDSGPDTTYVYGSLAIGNWAARKAGRLIPQGNSETAYHHWMGVVMTDLAPAFSAHFHLDVLAETPQTWGVACFTDMIDRLLTVIDQHLKDNCYMLGDEYSLVDVMLYPAATSSLDRLRERLPDYAHVSRWASHVGQRHAVRQGMAASS